MFTADKQGSSGVELPFVGVCGICPLLLSNSGVDRKKPHENMHDSGHTRIGIHFQTVCPLKTQFIMDGEPIAREVPGLLLGNRLVTGKDQYVLPY